MDEFRRLPRKQQKRSVSRPRRVDSNEARRRYRALRERRPEATKNMTYDDYLKAVNNTDKLFEVDEKSVSERFESFKETTISAISSGTNWVREKTKPLLKTLARYSAAVTASQKNTRTAGAVVIGVFLLIVLSMTFIKSDDEFGESGAEVAGNAATPDFDFLENANNTSDGESSSFGFDPEAGVVSFSDEVGGAPVAVSQQPVPQEFRGTGLFLLQAADVLGATERIDTEKGRVYYLEGESELLTDTVLFEYNDVLVNIRPTSGAQIKRDALVDYINSLN